MPFRYNKVATEYLHADDVVARIDVVDLAGDAARQVGQEVERGLADLLDASRCGAAASCTRSTSGCSGNRRCPLAASVLIGPAEIALTRMPCLAEIDGEIRTLASSAALATPMTL
jgi:hypothetical protein